VNVALTVADRAWFMEKGELKFSGPTRELLDRPDILRSVFLQGASTGPTSREGRPVRRTVPLRAVRTSANGTAPALELRGLSVSFGGISAVQDLSFSVQPGEIVGVIGPNGAGKTTLFDLVSGFTRPTSGVVLLNGDDVTTASPSRRARLGMGRSFQDSHLFRSLTVSETLAVALERWIDAGDTLSAALRAPAANDTEAAVAARVDDLIETFGLGRYRDSFIGDLSTGTRRLVDLAGVVAHGPDIVLLDEPSSGIAQREAEALGPLLVRLRAQLGATLLVVEHDMRLISSIANRLVAMDQGRLVTQGPPTDVLAHPQVLEAYLGTGAARQRSGRLQPAARHRSLRTTEATTP
jgi:branched-chain amino acid transport system ATP-binding protein